MGRPRIDAQASPIPCPITKHISGGLRLWHVCIHFKREEMKTKVNVKQERVCFSQGGGPHTAPMLGGPAWLDRWLHRLNCPSARGVNVKITPEHSVTPRDPKGQRLLA